MSEPLPFHSIHRHGLVRLAAATPAVFVADPTQNARAVLDLAGQAERDGVDLVVFPELCLTGYAIDDLLTQQALLDSARAALASIVTASERIRAAAASGKPST
jgi:NAD+ synthase (glutamine-hydrolysing)